MNLEQHLEDIFRSTGDDWYQAFMGDEPMNVSIDTRLFQSDVVALNVACKAILGYKKNDNPPELFSYQRVQHTPNSAPNGLDSMPSAYALMLYLAKRVFETEDETKRVKSKDILEFYQHNWLQKVLDRSKQRGEDKVEALAIKQRKLRPVYRVLSEVDVKSILCWRTITLKSFAMIFNNLPPFDCFDEGVPLYVRNRVTRTEDKLIEGDKYAEISPVPNLEGCSPILGPIRCYRPLDLVDFLQEKHSPQDASGAFSTVIKDTETIKQIRSYHLDTFPISIYGKERIDLSRFDDSVNEGHPQMVRASVYGSRGGQISQTLPKARRTGFILGYALEAMVLDQAGAGAPRWAKQEDWEVFTDSLEAEPYSALLALLSNSAKHNFGQIGSGTAPRGFTKRKIGDVLKAVLEEGEGLEKIIGHYKPS